MFLLNFITSKYSFFRRIIQVWYQYFQICLVLDQFLLKHFLSCSGSVVSEKFLVFYFPFSQFLTVIPSTPQPLSSFANTTPIRLVFVYEISCSGLIMRCFNLQYRNTGTTILIFSEVASIIRFLCVQKCRPSPQPCVFLIEILTRYYLETASQNQADYLHF